jgi:hypothetical protein
MSSFSSSSFTGRRETGASNPNSLLRDICVVLCMMSVGVTTEVIFTGVNGSACLLQHGECPLIMFPAYAATTLLAMFLSGAPFMIKGLLGPVLIMGTEAAIGFAMGDVCPWRDAYLESGRSWLNGTVRWDYFPLWVLTTFIWCGVWEAIAKPIVVTRIIFHRRSRKD